MHALYFVRYIYCLFVVVFLFKKKKKKEKTEKKSRSALSRSVVPPFRVPSFLGLLTTFSFQLFFFIIRGKRNVKSTSFDEKNPEVTFVFINKKNNFEKKKKRKIK